MGLFDLFGRDPKTKNESASRQVSSAINNALPTEKGPVAIFAPNAYSDVETIITAIKQGKTAIVHLTELKTETAIRVLDMLCGAIYALDGGVYEMEKNIFMFSPSGIELN